MEEVKDVEGGASGMEDGRSKIHEEMVFICFLEGLSRTRGRKRFRAG